MLGFRSLGLVVLVLFMAFSNAADADSSDDNSLNLDWNSVCTAADTWSQGQCANRQAEKAERWLQAILERCERVSSEAMDDLRQGGNEPFDQIAQLRLSQDLFEKFRRAAADQAHGFGYPGSGSIIEAARASFRLTVERVQFLRDICGCRSEGADPNMIDLTKTNWCDPK